MARGSRRDLRQVAVAGLLSIFVLSISASHESSASGYLAANYGLSADYIWYSQWRYPPGSTTRIPGQPGSIPPGWSNIHFPPTILLYPASFTEEELRSRATKTLEVTMVDDMWEPSIGVEEASTARWVNEALDTPASDATHGFNAVVKPRLTVERVDDHVLSLSFGWLPEFDVDAEEYVHVTAPFWATQRNLSAVPGVSVTTDLNFSIGVSTPRAYAWGELVGAVVPEEALRSRSHVLHLALEGCDWPVDAGTPGSAAYAALSEALIGQTDVGAVPGESGWMMAASSLLMAQRWNATHLSLTVPPLAAYDIAAPETVEVTVPGAALLQHHEALRAIASFVVVPEGGSARLGGSLLHLNSSARASGATLAGRTLEVSLVADTFVEALRTNTSLHRRLLRGVSSRTSVEAEPFGWNAFVERALRPGENQSEAQRGTGNVSVEVSQDARLLRLTIPADDEASRYAISAPETISMLLPAEVRARVGLG